ncbi:MAG: glycosyltransferase family 9 protein [Chlorobium sp.]
MPNCRILMPHDRSLIVVGPDHIGDTIIALPALGSLVECERYKRVGIIVNDQAAPIVAEIFRVVKCFPCPPVYYSWLRTTYHATRLALRVSLLGYTDILDLRDDRISNAVSATISVLGLTRDSKHYICDHMKDVVMPVSKIQYAHEHYERLVAKFLERRPRNLISLLKTSQHLLARVVDKMSSPRLHGICLCPGASTKSKSWPLRNWILLGKILLKAGYSVSMIVNPNENLRSLKKTIAAMDVRILLDSSLHGVARNLAGADMAITCDSALSHLAFAVGTPVLTLFGPTEPSKWFPYHLVGGGTAISLTAKPNCHPCQRMSCTSGTPCMLRLSVEELATAIFNYHAANFSKIFLLGK